MKYYYNRIKDLLLVDETNYTPYLTDRGYEEITKEEYDQKIEEKLRELEEGE